MGEGAGAIVERPPFVCPALVPAAAALSGSLFCAGRNITEFIVAGSVALIVLFLFRNDRTHVRVFAVTAVLFYLWTWALAPVAVQPGERTVRGVCADVRKYPVSQRVILETAGCGRIALTVIDIVPDLSEGRDLPGRPVFGCAGTRDGRPFGPGRPYFRHGVSFGERYHGNRRRQIAPLHDIVLPQGSVR